MALRTLSDLESKLVMELEWQEEQLVTLRDVMDILGCSYAHARKLAHQLEKKRWLDRLAPGKYQFIPASRGSQAVPDMNPLLAGSMLVEPYYFSYATANHFYGFSPQVPATVYVATTKTKRPTEIRGVEYRFVSLKPSKFFGYQKARVYTAEVMMAEPEKAVVDSLDKMGYAGGIAEVARVIQEKRLGLMLTIHSWQGSHEFSEMGTIRTAGDSLLTDSRSGWASATMQLLLRNVPVGQHRLSEKIWHPGLARDYLLDTYDALTFRIEITTAGLAPDGFRLTARRILENLGRIADWAPACSPT